MATYTERQTTGQAIRDEDFNNFLSVTDRITRKNVCVYKYILQKTKIYNIYGISHTHTHTNTQHIYKYVKT